MSRSEFETNLNSQNLVLVPENIGNLQYMYWVESHVLTPAKDKVKPFTVYI
jgi:hypothetical protein